MCFECEREQMSRRDFLVGTTIAIAGLALPQNFSAQDNSKVVAENVSFKNGKDIILGYLTRPNKKGRHIAIIMVNGDLGVADWLKAVSNDLSLNGYVALTIDLDSRKEPPRPADEYIGNELDRRVTQDIFAAIEYLKKQSFVKKRGGMGMVGFCFGGRKALTIPTETKDIIASVSFYGPVIDHRRYEKDPRPDVVSVASKIKIPVQGHYGTLDPVAIAKDAKEFEETLKKQRTPVEMYFYEGAGHGFYGNAWAQQTPEFGYNAEAAKLARERMLAFLKRYLK